MAGSAYFVLEGALGDGLGASIGTAGNFDAGGSGIDEFIVGSSNENGLGVIILTGSSNDTDGIEGGGTNLDRITFSTPAGEGTGAVVLGGYDFNGDGITDVAISAPDANAGDGAVYVIYGGATALNENLTAADLDGTNGIVINGLSGSDGFGESLSAQARDGQSDLLFIGAQAFGAGSDAGQGAVVSVDLDGSTSSGLTLLNYGSTIGADGGDNFGASIEGDVDLDGDGIGDLAIGAPGADDVETSPGGDVVVPNTGEVIITLSGGGTVTLTGAAATDAAGTVVASAGDFNGDGIDDLLISAPNNDAGGNNAGTVYVLFGKNTAFQSSYDLGSLSPADGISLSGSTANGQAGLSASGVGDVDGDGVDDVLITGLDGSGAGRAYLVFGGVGISSLDLETLDGTDGYVFADMDLGFFEEPMSAAGLGDVNNDGINDIALAAPDANDGQLLGVLGGSANLALLDGLDGAADGSIDTSNFFDGSLPDADFVASNDDVSFGGISTGDIDLRAGEDSVSGTISIIDVSTVGPDSFDTEADDLVPEASGTYGDIFITDGTGDEDDWTYLINGAGLIALQAINGGDEITDTVILTADNGSQRAITITLTGEDDPAEFTITPNVNGVGLTEDAASVSGAFAVSDPDAGDNPDLSGQSFEGENGFGTFIVSEDGTEFTFVLNPDLPDQGFGEDLTEVIAPFGSDGDTFELIIEGRNEDATPATGGAYTLVAAGPGEGANAFFGGGDENITGSAEGDTIDTGAGNDVVDGGAGDDVITDSFGSDTLEGGAGNDDITTLSGTNLITDGGATTGTAAESNYFKGGVGKDTLVGGIGDDFLDGDAASSLIGASDILNGGAGNDYLRGGLGTDTFIFAEGYGDDVIADFEATSNGSSFALDGSLGADFVVGLDTVLITGAFGGLTQADIVDALSDAPTLGNAVFSNDGNGNAQFTVTGFTDSLTFWGVSVDELTADSFAFV